MKLIIVILLAFPVSLCSQDLVDGSRYKYRLRNGEDVTVYSTKDCRQCFYYLPLNLAIARKQDGTPEISLITWKNDENSKVIGGILHFLVHWSMSAEEEGEIALRLKTQVDSNSVMMGPASVNPGNEPYFQGNDDLASLLTSHLNSVPAVPVTPGSKIAFSFRFGEDTIGSLMQYVENPSKTVTKLIVPYTYTTWSVNQGMKEHSLQLELCLSEVLKLIR